jgi:hypothetical protein
MANPERYRKLPGRRRGIIRGASAWLGADHVLLVKSLRFREEYKRYYLRDIQAVATADAPRFHLSVRSFVLAMFWLFFYAIFANTGRYSGPLTLFLWIVAVLLVGAWLIVSAAFSCRCRIYTAVSSDELPSVYRSWTARRFVAELQQSIAAVQGTLEGNWAEAVESYHVGPPRALPPEMPAGGAAPSPAAAEPPRPWAAYAFIASLLAGAAANYLLLPKTGWISQWILPIFTLCQAASTVAVLVACRRRGLRPAWRNLAIVTLIAVAITYRVNYSFGTFAAIGRLGEQGNPMVNLFTHFASISTVFVAGLHGLLGLIGIVLLATGQPKARIARLNI